MDLSTNNVLLVEDDSLVHNVITKILISGGFGVISAMTGTEAIAEIENPDRQFRLAILDIFLPDMMGYDLLDCLNTHRPDTAILMMSGFNLETEELSIVRELELPFIRKPFSVKDFLDAVADTLLQAR
jgi:DNA-binding NtrC family response regulator